MKHSGLFFLLWIQWISCTRNPNQVSQKTTAPDSFQTVLPSQTVQGQFSRLDSLQGTWISVQDSLWKIKITRTQFIAIIDNEIEEETDFYLADRCVEDFKAIEPKQNRSGEFLISSTKRDSSVFCYQIEDLTSESFSYLYAHSKYHAFTRCADFKLD
jgi:hypothetical protein